MWAVKTGTNKRETKGMSFPIHRSQISEEALLGGRLPDVARFVFLVTANFGASVEIKTSPYRAVNTLHLGYTNQSVNAV